MVQFILSKYGLIEKQSKGSIILSTPTGIQVWIPQRKPNKSSKKCVNCGHSVKGSIPYYPILGQSMKPKDIICKHCISLMKPIMEMNNNCVSFKIMGIEHETYFN